MNETVKIWFKDLYEKEIEEVRGTISNEHLCELGYDGDEPYNPHSENILLLTEYLDELTRRMNEIEL